MKSPSQPTNRSVVFAWMRQLISVIMKPAHEAPRPIAPAMTVDDGTIAQ